MDTVTRIEQLSARAEMMASGPRWKPCLRRVAPEVASAVAGREGVAEDLEKVPPALPPGDGVRRLLFLRREDLLKSAAAPPAAATLRLRCLSRWSLCISHWSVAWQAEERQK